MITEGQEKTGEGYGCDSATDTFSMEALALLNGLYFICRKVSNPHVCEITWYTDCQGLIQALDNDRLSSCVYVNTIKQLLDIHHIKMHRHYVPRETEFSEFRTCDLRASSMRLLIKTWAEET